MTVIITSPKLRKAEAEVVKREKMLRTAEDHLKKASLAYGKAWSAHATALHNWSSIKFGPWPR